MCAVGDSVLGQGSASGGWDGLAVLIAMKYSSTQFHCLAAENELTTSRKNKKGRKEI